MPKTKFQNIIFTLIMAFIMVYAMICYNISLNKGQMSNEVFFACISRNGYNVACRIHILWSFRSRKTCDKACIQIYKTWSG